jgi:RNA polymerase sigma-70 factor (ECF subfamily)
MDKSEFEQRSLAMAQRLYRIAYTILYSDADCKDAVSEALLRAWVSRSALRNPALFETWLVRILINTGRDMLKKRSTLYSSELSDAIPAQEPPDPALGAALQSLELKYRLIITMHHIEGYSLKEIAVLLKLPLSTVKWRLHAGRRMLRDRLTEGDDAQ